jgi:glyoxylase-like metal-dependent hydrolase (beta-lactamase superfamily II)
MLDIKTFVCNLLSENTYVVSDETKECVIIDCGAYYEEERAAILNYISDNGLKPVHLLATHGHFDHNYGIDTIYDNYGLKVEIAAEDDFLITDLPGQFKSIVGVELKRKFPSVGRYFLPGENIRFGNHQFSILKTPGHTPGGVTYMIEDCLFTGDTLFRLSCGRYDFPASSALELGHSLEKLRDLEGDFEVFPGHESPTTLDFERRFNPYMLNPWRL